jgi:hypothetical protein
MRVIEMFTSVESIKKNAPAGSTDQDVVKFLKLLFSYMIEQNYFQIVRKMLNEKVPEHTYDQVTTRPHNEISRVLLEMIVRPLKLVNSFEADSSFDSKILSSFIIEILTKDFSDTISNFIVPSLGSQCDFPFIKLLRFLYETHMQSLHCSESDDAMENNNCREVSQYHKKVKFNGYLLYSILKLDAKFLDDVISQNYLSHFLIVIGAMIGHISRLPKPNQYMGFSNFDEDESENFSDSDEDDNGEDEDMQPQLERLILSETIVLLNEQNRVGKIVKSIDGLLCRTEVVHSLCVICHNLMIYNKAAINEYR